jgi:glutamate N-acetyltransferase/amino-acid N-acetyltransferase
VAGALSPLAVPFPDLPPLAGVRLAAGQAGIRYRGRDDVLLAEFAPGTTVAGVLTRNRCPGAPVDWCRAHLAHGSARGLVVSAGNANVFTGRAGAQAVRATAEAAAHLLGARAEQIFIASTGVIGEPFPTERLLGVLPDLRAALAPGGFERAARAIMTTDTFPKGAIRRVRLGEAEVTVQGFAKGSGMIAPDLATMLAFVFTDAKVPAPLLADLLRKGVAGSFNAITVDSDTSTSDTLLLFATGAADHPPLEGREGARLRARFARALDAVLKDLALQVVRDGEGAQKLIHVAVRGAVSVRSARRIARAIADSPLVKTAIAGEDANWGRIVAAVGKAGEPADRDRLAIAIGGVTVAREGAVVPGYDEAPVVAHMKGREIEIAVDLGLGRGRAEMWTCDLTHGYIDINGSYRS